VQVYFSSSHIGLIVITYTVKGLDHGWTRSVSVGFFGSYGVGLHRFTLQSGWSFANSQHAFGQGNYQFYSASIESQYGWSDFKIGSGSNINFKVNPSSSSRVVFLAVIYDSYFNTNYHTLNDPVTTYINSAIGHISSNFPITYYYTLKLINWVPESSIIEDPNGGRWYTSLTFQQIFSNHRIGVKNAFNLNNNWDSFSLAMDKYTKKNNNGYDQTLGIAGLIRHPDSNHNVAAGMANEPGNQAWVTTGVAYYTFGVLASFL
jgi:hypothetical protein